MRVLSTLLLLAVMATACGEAEVGTQPDLALGRDVCEACGMIIEDERFASGYVDDDGEHVFDDIGDLLMHLAEHDRFDEVTPWVHDYLEPRWLEAASAHYVRGTDIRTPMEHGIAAFADEAAAIAFAEEVGGEHLHWHQLAADAQAGAMSPEDHQNDNQHDTGSDPGGEHDDDH